MSLTYCDFVAGSGKNTIHKAYHDNEYGFPLKSDDELFERLILEINQAGLSWETILKKRVTFKKAYRDFEVKKVAKFNQRDFERLMQDPGIIRNRLKIEAAVHNANVVLNLQKQFGSFGNWLDHHHPKSKEEWMQIFKKAFRFTGGEIVNEFLISTGYLPCSHDESCPVYKKVIRAKPRWLVGKRGGPS